MSRSTLRLKIERRMQLHGETFDEARERVKRECPELYAQTMAGSYGPGGMAGSIRAEVVEQTRDADRVADGLFGDLLAHCEREGVTFAEALETLRAEHPNEWARVSKRYALPAAS